MFFWNRIKAWLNPNFDLEFFEAMQDVRETFVKSATRRVQRDPGLAFVTKVIGDCRSEGMYPVPSGVNAPLSKLEDLLTELETKPNDRIMVACYLVARELHRGKHRK